MEEKIERKKLRKKAMKMSNESILKKENKWIWKGRYEEKRVELRKKDRKEDNFSNKFYNTKENKLTLCNKKMVHL